MSPFSRRTFLGLAGVFAAGTATYGMGLLGCRFVERNVPDFFATLDPNERSALSFVGKQVIAQYPDYASASFIEAELGAKPVLRQARARQCPNERMGMFQDQCRLDYETDATLLVDGWVLSRTEAAMCAYLA